MNAVGILCLLGLGTMRLDHGVGAAVLPMLIMGEVVGNLMGETEGKRGFVCFGGSS